MAVTVLGRGKSTNGRKYSKEEVGDKRSERPSTLTCVEVREQLQ
jgi:hypothetical protein